MASGSAGEGAGSNTDKKHQNSSSSRLTTPVFATSQVLWPHEPVNPAQRQATPRQPTIIIETTHSTHSHARHLRGRHTPRNYSNARGTDSSSAPESSQLTSAEGVRGAERLPRPSDHLRWGCWVSPSAKRRVASDADGERDREYGHGHPQGPPSPRGKNERRVAWVIPIRAVLGHGG